MVRLIMLGGPGSGKGTQAEKLATHFNLTIVSTGNILRDAIATEDDQLGTQAKEYVNKGELVPDSMMIKFIKRRLMEADVAQGWILEGYPRTAFQAEELDFLLEELQQKLDYAIYLEVEEATMMQRSLARGQVDDQPDVINKRIDLFEQRTTPILEYYQCKHNLIKVSGEDIPETITAKILERIEL